MAEVKNDGKRVQKTLSEEDLNKLLKIVGEVQYGSVTLFVQEGRVVQIEKNEKIKIR